ncbi:MAG: deoxyribodipyrimidine photolyase [Desulfuromonadales bacterium]|nr:deoxyribodipyrimidine photolyase [Desulfuromonadales bacterium]
MTTSITLPCSFSPLRLQTGNQRPVNPQGHYILYWMIAARRCHWNFGLQRATEAARELGVGLLICEPLPCDDPFACERTHHFIIEGMRDNRNHLSGKPVLYWPWVETCPGESRGLLESLAAEACLVVTDHVTTATLPRLLGMAPEKLPMRLEVVDANGLLPLAVTEKAYTTAYAFRRLLHKALPAFIDDRPLADPLIKLQLPPVVPPRAVTERWPAADPDALLAENHLNKLPIDHLVKPAPLCGGSESAESRLEDFLSEDLAAYTEQRNIPDLDRTSHMSAYLHFGQISSHQIFARLAEKEGWTSRRLALKPSGQRCGWWGMSESAEAFLDELVTWRELGHVFCQHRTDYAEYRGLPDWARTSLNLHRADPRPRLYSKEELESAQTHDLLWNAAQRQLLREGRIHSYLRMLWGKKILEWSTDPETALQTMIELNDRHALDGRDPNSYSGISWCLGRFDRPWGPERPVFGKVRYMSSENTARKTSVKKYLERYS